MRTTTYTTSYAVAKEDKTSHVIVRSKDAGLARLNTRLSSFTPEILAEFNNDDLPEMSGNPKKRFVFF